MIDPTIAQIGIPGGVELLVVLLIAVLLFGANKIPELARASGQALGEFKRGAEESKEALQGAAEDGGDVDDEDLEPAD
ncbi:twin-arginine translocation protein, TatA/E family subunit [Haloferax mucosum ATCC BAA-1512]|uniref:Twin-arginine translocation protein, TatA/E family subunit n=1 Tax=Haloferax mucosum ATCC BAA-1512 TaxID=662479 RepID=M0II60_9EURY|nr:twin-arginine translocase TatA/TatE family subunit [Haloferax mucosum]ELZ96461.1 twin-arginine translocation protein, TatA/E family subunit [Haloferax mucosum ATCC BAA-1512]